MVLSNNNMSPCILRISNILDVWKFYSLLWQGFGTEAALPATLVEQRLRIEPLTVTTVPQVSSLRPKRWHQQNRGSRIDIFLRADNPSWGLVAADCIDLLQSGVSPLPLSAKLIEQMVYTRFCCHLLSNFPMFERCLFGQSELLESKAHQECCS